MTTGAETETAFFLKDGSPYVGAVFEMDDGRAFGEVTASCPACGGSGTGRRGTCRRCNGTRSVFDQAIVYTEAQLEKLRAGQDKRRQRKQAAEIERLEAIHQAHLDCETQNQDVYDRARREPDQRFLADCLSKSEEHGGLSEAQLAKMRRILDDLDEDRLRYAGSVALGAIGDRVDAVLTGVRTWVQQVEAYVGAGMVDVHVSELMDEDGNAVVVVHRSLSFEPGERAVISGQVTEASDAKGWTRTRLSRVAVLERLPSIEPPGVSP